MVTLSVYLYDCMPAFVSPPTLDFVKTAASSPFRDESHPQVFSHTDIDFAKSVLCRKLARTRVVGRSTVVAGASVGYGLTTGLLVFDARLAISDSP